VIALSDDLTGAVACAGEFRRAGATPVVVGWQRFSTARSLGGVVVIDTASRLLPEAAAADRMGAVLRRIENTTPIYKRIDSGLRGPIGAELDVLSRYYEAPCVIALAAPEFGVTTMNGAQVFYGAPTVKATAPRDQDEPRPGAIHELLRGTVSELHLTAVRSPNFSHVLADAARHSDHVVCDSESLDDLAIIAEALRSASATTPMIPVGSYGLAAPFAGPGIIDTASARPGILTVVTSCDEAARTQVRNAGRCGMVVRCWEIGDSIADLAPMLRSGSDVILTTGTRHNEARGRARDSAYAHELASTLSGDNALRSFDRVILIGGELCSHISRLAKTTAIVIEAEPWPATPIVRFRGGPNDGLLGILKSGGREGPNWIVRAADVLRSWA
jgi:D-threonate/D-erythronate kinase